MSSPPDASAPGQAGTSGPGLLGLVDLEIWCPISGPMADPNQSNFVTSVCGATACISTPRPGVTRGILLADYLNSILAG